MENNLFTQINDQQEENSVKVEENFYQKVLETRKRPELPEDKLFSEDKHENKQEVPQVRELFLETEIKKEIKLSPFPYQQVLEESTRYFKGDSLAANVWINKYALKNSNGDIFELTPDDMHLRLAKEVARIEKKYPNPMSEKELFELFRKFKYIIPQGSPMAGIGNNFQISSLSNCFVLGNDGNADSYGGILKVDEEQVQLMKRRGGVGHDLSHIRPAGSTVLNTALTSTGIVPFMERYSNSTREVAQDGRRGALMLSISSKHPDAEHFIDAKLEKGKVTGANVSVRIDDDFMQCIIEGRKYIQQYPIDSKNPTYVKETDAKVLWDKIIHNAWRSAEPGVLFWDTIIKESIPDCYADLGFKTVSTNPCGEIPLCPYDSCRLLAINLFNYVKNPFANNAEFDFELFCKHAQYAQRIMDDIIDLEVEKIDKIIAKIDSDPESYEIKRTERKLWENIRAKCLEGRRTGIGITAEGDMLAALGYRYGSPESNEFAVMVQKTLAIEVYRGSVNLAKERGCFPIFDSEREKNNPFISRIKQAAPDIYENMKSYGRRNIAMLTIAPTGSVSICTQTTSGIEPVFMISYKRRRKVNPNDQNIKVDFIDEIGDSWEEYRVFHHNFNIWLEVNSYNPKEVEKMDDAALQEIIAKSPYYKATANDIDWLSKVKMQGAIQKWVDHSISVTVNIPKETSEDMVSQIYKTAWESGCKGMTIYRDGSRAGVLLNDTKKEDNDNEFKETKAPRRSKKLIADVVRFQNDYEKWIAVVGLINERPYEIFTGKAEDFWIPPLVNRGWVVKVRLEKGESRYDFEYEDKDGYLNTLRGLSRAFDKEFWNYAKLISGALRHGMPLSYVVDLVSKLHSETESINTWKNGVVRALKKFIPDGTKASEKVCPECGKPDALLYKEGCLICRECGYSKCS